MRKPKYSVNEFHVLVIRGMNISCHYFSKKKNFLHLRPIIFLLKKSSQVCSEGECRESILAKDTEIVLSENKRTRINNETNNQKKDWDDSLNSPLIETGEISKRDAIVFAQNLCH